MDTDDVAIDVAVLASEASHSPHFLIDRFYFDDYCDLYYSNRNGVRVTSEALNGLRSTERIWIWA